MDANTNLASINLFEHQSKLIKESISTCYFTSTTTESPWQIHFHFHQIT